MERYKRSHLADQTLLSYLSKHLAQERGSTADLLADLAEVDERRLYRRAGYPSLYEYCLHELHLCEQAAYKRIFAARAARRFPAIFTAVAEGRLHLSAVVLLAPHLTEATADELLAAATHQTKAEIERRLAERFPRPDLPAAIEAIPSPPVARSTAPPPPAQTGLSPGKVTGQLSPGKVETPAAGQPVPEPHALGSGGDRPKVTPLAPQRFGVQFTMDQEAHDLLRYAQDLLGHEVPSGDVATVFKRALQALVPQLERQKFAATRKPQIGRRTSRPDTRHLPAEVKRSVWARDAGRCTYVSESGHRCSARRGLQFDHVEAFARGGHATVAGIRLRCWAHNQHEAERTYGAEFMRRKRLAAAERCVATKALEAAAARAGRG